MTAVTRAADAPRAASAISSSSTRCSCTGLTSGWMMNTSRSRQLAWSWTSRQSFANRSSWTGCCGTARKAQISAVSAGWALPPNTAISRTAGTLGLLLERRQAEALAELLLDDLAGGPRVHREHVLLAAEQVKRRAGLGVVVPHPDGQPLLGVVFPGDQLPAARVALARDLRAVRDQVVVHAAVGAQPAVQDPPADLAVGQVQLDDPVDVKALQEELGLPAVPREPVDDEAEVPVVLGEPVLDHRLDQVVADQFPGRHGAPDQGADLGVVLHVPAEDVSDADVHDVQVSGQQLALRALAAALHAHDHVFAHVNSLAYQVPSFPARSPRDQPGAGRACARRPAASGR